MADDQNWNWNEERNSYIGRNYDQNWQQPASDQFQNHRSTNTANANTSTNNYGSASFFANQSANLSSHASPYYANSQVQYGDYNQTPQNQYSLPGGVSQFSQQLISDPMLNAARQIGGQFAEQQKEKLTKYLSAFQLKYYFAVDNQYVGKKLRTILFPFFHGDWSVKYDSSDNPLPPKLDANAPDLYIPLMAFVTYILISGFVLGTQERFTPEQLGIITTNALIYLIFENIIIFMTRYIMNISLSLTFWHSLVYSSYKFVGMVACLVAFAVGGRTLYLWFLAYTSFAIVFFLLRTVKNFVLDVQSVYEGDGGRKRKIYLLLFITFTQPFLIWWLTSGVTSHSPSKLDFAQLALSGMGFKEAISKGSMPKLPDGEIDYEALLKMP